VSFSFASASSCLTSAVYVFISIFSD